MPWQNTTRIASVAIPKLKGSEMALLLFIAGIVLFCSGHWIFGTICIIAALAA